MRVTVGQVAGDGCGLSRAQSRPGGRMRLRAARRGVTALEGPYGRERARLPGTAAA